MHGSYALTNISMVSSISLSALFALGEEILLGREKSYLIIRPKLIGRIEYIEDIFVASGLDTYRRQI